MLLNETLEPSSGLPYVDQMTPEGIQRRYLAALPTPADHPMRALPGFEAGTGITPIPRSQIGSLLFERRHTEIPILDQNGIGSCVSYAATLAAMFARAVSGAPFQLLSPGFFYTEINGGFDGGSNAGTAVQAGMNVGWCLNSTVPGRPIRPKGVSAAAIAEASRFKLRDALLLTTVEEVWTAMLYGWAVLLDVQAGNAYNTDSSGTIAYLGNRTNHENCIKEGLRLGPDGRVQFLDRNSWGVSWGQGGFGWLTEDHITASNTLYAIRYMQEDPQDNTMPPALSA